MINKVNTKGREWYKDSIDQIYKKFDSNINGLSDFQYKDNLKKFGNNQLSNTKKTSYFNIR